MVDKYKPFYTDYYERCTEFMQETTHPRDVEQIDKLLHNFE
jgi:hypothetical protein